MTDAAEEFVVITSYGRRFDLRSGVGRVVPARVRGRRLRPVCGDRVRAEALPNETDRLIIDVLPRANELARPDARGRREVLAANLTLIAVVAARSPKPDWYVIDRYLAAAELMEAMAIVVWNKTDLRADDAADRELAVYEAIGYPLVRTSAARSDGLDELVSALDGQTAIFTGQSGAGKSSLLNRLDPHLRLATGAISRKSGEGRHTTVKSSMFEIARGSFVIDSPGVRDFAPSIDEPERVERGFREISAASVGCHYADCRHLAEPDCAVRRGVDSGAISARRLESYKRLLRLTEEFSARY